MGSAVRRTYRGVRVTSLDRQFTHLQLAAPPRLCADAFHLPFSPRSFDVVLCPLLMREYVHEDAARLVSSLPGVCRRALIILDLYRHALAYYFLPASRVLFGWSEITLHDGPVSVEASYRPDELVRLAQDAGLLHLHVRHHVPWFRVSLVAKR